MSEFEGKTVVVTGASNGIGRAVAKRFVVEGANVVVNSRSEERATSAAAEIGAGGPGEAIGVAADASVYGQVEAMIDETVDRFGSLDVLVGNAGIHDDSIALEDVPADELDDSFDELFGINVKGYLNAAKAAIPHLRDSGGNMIFTASYASFNPGTGGIFYTPAKHAVVGVVRQLALELAPEIRVNGVAPNYVPTDLEGMQSLDQGAILDDVKAAGERWLQERFELPILDPDGYGGYYVFLASEDSAASTGTVLSADCGSVISD
jgi:NAD(P)-dependent dehydrogenase (short-subunit alcohol dehydrogenase family)